MLLKRNSRVTKCEAKRSTFAAKEFASAVPIFWESVPRSMRILVPCHVCNGDDSLGTLSSGKMSIIGPLLGVT